MTIDMQQTLERIRDAVNAALKESRGKVDDAVNWADLKCNDVRHYQSVHGDDGFTAIIDEASPDADKLRAFVADYIAAAGFPYVEVITEW